MTLEDQIEKVWQEYRRTKGPSRDVFKSVVGPLIEVLRKTAEGGMFSETNAIIAARRALKYADTAGDSQS